MATILIWSLDDFGASSLGNLFNGTFTISGTPDVASFTDDDPNFDDFFGNGGQTQDPGLNQFLDSNLTVDGTLVGVPGDGIYNAAEGTIVNNTTGETGRILYVTINGGTVNEFVGVATTIPIRPGDNVSTSNLSPRATEPISEIIACFTPGTLIRTNMGPMPVECLSPGDLVMTVDDGLQPLRWKGRRFVSGGRLLQEPGLRPIHIAAGSLGDNLPERDLTVSPQHRMLVDGPDVELYFGFEEALVPAGSLTMLDGVTQITPDHGVDYIHLLFDRHQLLYCEGARTESFHPFALSKTDPDSDAVAEELFTLFPDLRDNPESYGGTARPSLRMQEAKLLLSMKDGHDATPAETLPHAERSPNERVA